MYFNKNHRECKTAVFITLPSHLAGKKCMIKEDRGDGDKCVFNS